MELSYENPTAYMTCGSSALVKFETHLFDYERYGIPSYTKVVYEGRRWLVDYEGTKVEGTTVVSRLRRYEGNI